MFKKIRNKMNKKEHTEDLQDQHTQAAANENEEVRIEQEQQENDKQDNTEPTAEQVEQAAEDVQEQINELKDKYLRLFAEFENYKRRTVKERLEMMKTAAQDTMTALLPILDDFDRAKKTAEDNDKPEEFSEGIQLVYNKLHNTLKQKGLKAMDTNGQPFDPELHEAMTEIPAPSEDMKGKIVDTIERGYWLNDKIIRHAKVVVGK